MKRKRAGKHASDAVKRPRLENVNFEQHSLLLRRYYPHVSTLRDHLAAHLPKSRRRRFHGRTGQAEALTVLLDRTLVGSLQPTILCDADSIQEDLTVYSQQLAGTATQTSLTQGCPKQSDILDFVLWNLFRRSNDGSRPQHLLCHGYQSNPGESMQQHAVAVPGAPGVYLCSANPHANALTERPWSDLPPLLGKHAEQLLTKLYLDCGIFVPLDDLGNYEQISGTPLNDLRLLDISPTEIVVKKVDPNSKPRETQRLSSIRPLRHKILYARPCLKANGSIIVGIGPSHALERYTDRTSMDQTVRLAQYIFPRAFGLHNVFESSVTRGETNQPYRDYTFREDEISQARCHGRNNRAQQGGELDSSRPRNHSITVPRRIRGPTLRLVHRLRQRHARCAYHALLRYYCPDTSSANTLLKSEDRAASFQQVSAFCRAVIAKVIPSDLWGFGETQCHNKNVVSRNVDAFIRLRRFESFSLHDMMQNMQIGDIAWLSMAGDSKNMDLSDLRKRSELMAELLFWLFDSFLIPLLRTNFYVTESSSHRNRLFYFRQDVWQAMTRPAFAALHADILEECGVENRQALLAQRTLGVSRLRFLPKENGMRPIINLRRRVQKTRNGRRVLGKSINNLLTPAFSILNFEKERYPEMIGSASFSANDLVSKLQAFRDRLSESNNAGCKLYFAKVDVRACFDTLPQDKLMGLVASLLSSNQYQISRHSRAQLVRLASTTDTNLSIKPSWKFLHRAFAEGESQDLAREASVQMRARRGPSIFVQGHGGKTEHRHSIIKLLREHIECNLLQVGRKFYRQRKGIAQGSIMSTLLCSYLYAEMERECLSFVKVGESILLRLIDDFLVVSVHQQVAERFLHVMQSGVPSYGIEIKQEKTMTNFEVDAQSSSAVQICEGTDFPYCGLTINTVTLDISRDIERRSKQSMADTITVEASRRPGQAYVQKTLTGVKMQMHGLWLSASHNNVNTLLTNIYHAFVEVAQKSYHYIQSLAPAKRPRNVLLIRTINDAINIAQKTLERRPALADRPDDIARVTRRAQIRWSACTAFCAVLDRRQTNYRATLKWLHSELDVPAMRVHHGAMISIVQQYESKVERGR